MYDKLWDMNIVSEAKRLIKKSITLNKRFMKIDNTDTDKHHTKTYNLIHQDYTLINNFLLITNLLKYVGTNKIMRRDSQTAHTLVTEHQIKLQLNNKIYRTIHKLTPKTPQQHIFLKRLLKEFTKTGITLSDKDKIKIFKLKRRIKKIESSLLRKLIKVKKIKLSNTELSNIPDNYKFKNKIPSTKINYLICMKHITNLSSRKKLDKIYRTIHNDKLTDITKLLTLRNDHAKLLSHKNHFQYITKNNISGNMANDFFKKLSTEIGGNNDSPTPPHTLDIPKLKLSNTSINKYFTSKSLIENIFTVFKKLFNIGFRHLNSKTWSKHVEKYSVTDQNKVIGYLYLDLYKRKNKYSQIRCFITQQPGPKQLPTATVVSSFHLRGARECISHNVVTKFFKEFAEAVCIILCKDYVSQDFIELISNVMRNLCWNKDVLKMLSCHVETKEELPNHLIDKIINSRSAHASIIYKEKIMNAMYDNLIHSSQVFLQNIKSTQPPTSTYLTKFYKQLSDSLLKTTFNEDCTMVIPWIDLISGYEGQYYNKLWCDVYGVCVFGDNHNGDGDNNIWKSFITLKENILHNPKTLSKFGLLKKYFGQSIKLTNFLSVYKFNNNNNNNTVVSGGGVADAATEFDENQYIDSDYMSENTESLLKYNKIFIPRSA